LIIDCAVDLTLRWSIEQFLVGLWEWNTW